jgi:MFS family permease
LVARLGLGAGEAALAPAAYSMLADLFPRRRLATAISTFSVGLILGGVGSLLIAAGLMAVLPREGLVLPFVGLTQPWRLVFILTGLPGLIVAWLIWTVREPVRRGRQLDSATSYSAALRFMTERWRFFGALFLAVGLMAAAGYAMAAWSAAYLMRRFGLSISETGVLLASVTVAPGIIGTIGTGAITDRWFAKGQTAAHLRVLIILSLLQIVAITLAIRAESSLPAALMFALCALLSGYAGIVAASLQLVTPNQYRGQVSATFLVCMNLIGLSLGPTLAGWFATHVFRNDVMIGWAIAAVYAILLPIAILLLYSAMKPMRRGVREAERWNTPPTS